MKLYNKGRRTNSDSIARCSPRAANEWRSCSNSKKLSTCLGASTVRFLLDSTPTEDHDYLSLVAENK